MYIKAVIENDFYYFLFSINKIINFNRKKQIMKSKEQIIKEKKILPYIIFIRLSI